MKNNIHRLAPSWSELIEASLEELQGYKPSLPQNEWFGFYGCVLDAYLRGDLGSLEKMAAKAEERATDLDWTCVARAARIRLQIRKREVPDDAISAFMGALEDVPSSSPWQGEFLFIAALAYEVREEHETSRDYYLRASHLLESLGATKKALKAFQNYIAAESRVHPEAKLLVEYHHVYQKARRAGVPEVAGLALMNISREYQRMGALTLSLKNIHRSIALLRKDFGSLHYFLAIAHRCHLQIQMKRLNEALLDFELVKTADFPEVKAALGVIQLMLQEARNEQGQPKKDLIMTWRERLAEAEGAPFDTRPGRLGEIEQKLLRFLLDGPKNRYDIISHLYGDRIDSMTSENRFKNVLARIRRKHPSLLVCSEGSYRIADRVFLPVEVLRAG